MRIFRSIANGWSPSERERLFLPGRPRRSTHHHWMRKVRDRQPLLLPFDALVRISTPIGIEGALEMLFEDRAQFLTWMRGAPRGTAFAGAAPYGDAYEGCRTE
jgi:hypothetical protein